MIQHQAKACDRSLPGSPVFHNLPRVLDKKYPDLQSIEAPTKGCLNRCFFFPQSSSILKISVDLNKINLALLRRNEELLE